MQLSRALDYLTQQAWCLHPPVFDQLASLIERHALGVRLDAAQIEAAIGRDPKAADAREPVYTVQGGEAVIPIRGVLARYADQVNGACQARGRSYESIQADLLRAAQDPTVARVTLRIDSPGGSATGAAETADLVRAVSAQGKPVTAYIDGQAASAAYWIASQADHVVASSPTALAGSIGVITAHVDTSRANEAGGVKVQVLRSTPLKAPGTAGEALQDHQLASIRALLADMHAAFSDAVAAGRGLTAEQQAAATTGEVFTAAKAIDLGLVDRIDPSLGAALAARSADVAAIPVPALRADEGALPTAAQAAPEPTPMDKQILALIRKHPAHAEALAAGAEAGKSLADLMALVASLDAAAAQAASAAALTAANGRIDALTAELATVKATLATRDADLAKLQAKHDALAGIKDGAATRDPGGEDPNTQVPTIPLARAQSLTSAELEAMKAGRLRFADQ